jgi:hypothetical protein
VATPSGDHGLRPADVPSAARASEGAALDCAHGARLAGWRLLATMVVAARRCHASRYGVGLVLYPSCTHWPGRDRSPGDGIGRLGWAIRRPCAAANGPGTPTDQKVHGESESGSQTRSCPGGRARTATAVVPLLTCTPAVDNAPPRTPGIALQAGGREGRPARSSHGCSRQRW